MRLLAGAALLALACSAAAAPEDRCAQAKALFSELAAQGLFQGAFVIDFGGREKCEGGHGFADVERKTPFTPRTPSDGGSIAKTMTAAAVLRLAEQGKLELDAAVRKYVPAYPYEATRVRHLITHSAGLPGYDWFDEKLGAGKLRSNAMQVEAVAKAGIAPLFVPGSAFAYDNAAYDTAALVIESVAGMPYAKYLEREFFQPFGMRDAFVRPAGLSDFAGTRTRGYRRGKSGLEPFDAIEGEAFHGASNVYLSAADLQAWAAAFVRADPIVAPARRHAQARARLANGHATGLSLSSWYSDRAAARHYYTGSHQGFYVMAYWDATRGRSFGFAVNQRPPWWLEVQLARALIDIGEGRPAQRPAAPQVSPAPAGAARWPVEGLGTVAVAPGKGPLLRITAPTGVEYDAFPVARNVWYVPGLDARLHWNDAGRLVWNTVFP